MRVFKTKWFAREARSHAITDEELCRAILETEQGKDYRMRRERLIHPTGQARSVG